MQARDLEFTQVGRRNSPAWSTSVHSEEIEGSAGAPKGFFDAEVPREAFSDLFQHFFGEGMEDFPDRDSQSLGSGSSSRPMDTS